MAEACRLGIQRNENKLTNTQEENFCVLNVLCVFISLVTILADLTTGKYQSKQFLELVKISSNWNISSLLWIIENDLQSALKHIISF